MIRDECNTNPMIAGQYKVPNSEYEREIVSPPTPDNSLYEYGPNSNNNNNISIDETTLFLNSIDKSDLLECDEMPCPDELQAPLTLSLSLLNALGAGELIQVNETPNEDRKVFPNLQEHDNGNIQFDLDLDPNICDSAKNNWYYSTLLNKVFIRLDKPFYIDVLYLPKIFEQLYLRVMIVYVDDMGSPVSRCSNHLFKDTIQDENEKHSLVRCGNDDVSYIGTVNGKNCEDRLQLLIKLNYIKPADENNSSCKQTIQLKFVCQNSCIGRKPTAVIFTLETRSKVLGKKIVNVKVCSCPKRDKKKDEENFNLKRKAEKDVLLPHGKRLLKVMKIKEEPCTNSDQNITAEPNQMNTISPIRITENGVQLILDMPNMSSATKVIKNSFDVVAGEMVNDHANSEKHKKYLRDIKKVMSNL